MEKTDTLFTDKDIRMEHGFGHLSLGFYLLGLMVLLMALAFVAAPSIYKTINRR